jgi:hypothetical protein
MTHFTARRSLCMAALLATAAAFTPTSASAEALLGAFLGTTFGGQADVKRPIYGGWLGAVGRSGVGFEIDFGYSPDFFDTEELTGFRTNVTTVMGNLVVGAPASGSSGVRPYASGGVGLMRANVSGPTDLVRDLSTNDFGINVGGGLDILLGPAFGVRGDLRYFRSLKGDENGGFPGVDLADFSFWRAGVGAILRW